MLLHVSRHIVGLLWFHFIFFRGHLKFLPKQIALRPFTQRLVGLEHTHLYCNLNRSRPGGKDSCFFFLFFLSIKRSAVLGSYALTINCLQYIVFQHLVDHLKVNFKSQSNAFYFLFFFLFFSPSHPE